MTIELLKKEEIPELLELYKELGDFEMDLEESKKAYDKMLSDENYYLLVAKEDDKIIGTVLGIVCHSLLILGKPFMVVEDVVVKEEYRRQGIGKKLFEEIDKISHERECLYSILVSSGHRKNAHVFYENQGYNDEVKGFRKKYF
jgi:GNAT superfamily N-acetyltransferase